MKAAVLRRPGEPLTIEEIDIDRPRAGEVLVRIAAAGVCRSDLHLARGVHPTPLPVVLGHEGAGTVAETGPGVSRVRAGDRVVLSWLPSCGTCRFCRDGRPVLCADLAWSDAGTMRDGTTRLHRDGRRIHHSTASCFAELAVVPESTVFPVPADLALPHVALVGCAVMTGVGAVLNSASVRPGQSVAVIGCGGVGLSVVQGAVIAGAGAIVAVDVAAGALERARALGATRTIEASGADAGAAVLEIVPGGCDHVFEALGTEETIALALRLTGRGGATTLVGLAPAGTRMVVDPLALTFEEKRISGCLYGSCVPDRDFPRVLDLCRSGRLRLDALVGGTVPLEGINEAFAALERGEGARTLIVFDA